MVNPKNPVRNPSKVIKTVLENFTVLTAFFVSIDVPYDYPNLKNKFLLTSPFTIIFQMSDTKSAGSFINAVIMTSASSACNHALFGGSRIPYNMDLEGFLLFSPLFTRINKYQIPYVAVVTTWDVDGFCFGASSIGTGQVFSWFQDIVSVSN